MSDNYRTETDSMGEVKVPESANYKSQTQRSLENFQIGTEKMPIEIIRSIALIKKCAAKANASFGKLSEADADKIASVSDDIRAGKYDSDFPLSVWQTGSGTHTNMNVNEVISHLTGLHPNDIINMSQSSNDVFPSAMQLATYLSAELKLKPAIKVLKGTFDELSCKWENTIKIGRTHLQDAVPMTLGQELSAFYEMLDKAEGRLGQAMQELTLLPIGGTAVGTGLNAPKGFDGKVCELLRDETGYDFAPEGNKFYGLSSKSNFAFFHSVLKALASDLFKVANDIRWLSAGPRANLSEIRIPENEPGSSIMPGKVNPSQAESLIMVCMQVFGNDYSVTLAAASGNFQLNICMPLIAYNTLQSIRLLAEGITSFNDRLAIGIVPNIPRLAEYIENSLMLVTALSPKIGYEEAAKIAKSAYENGTTLKEEALKSGLISEAEYSQIVDPKNMV